MVYRLIYVWNNRGSVIRQYMFPVNVHVGINRYSISVSYIITDMFSFNVHVGINRYSISVSYIITDMFSFNVHVGINRYSISVSYIITDMFSFNVHVGINRYSISVSYIITICSVCCNSLRSFPQSWVNGFIIRVTRRVPPVPDLPLCIGVLHYRALLASGSIFLPKKCFYDGFFLMWCNFNILTIPKFPQHVCLIARVGLLSLPPSRPK